MHERTMRTMPREGFAIAWLQALPVFKHAPILYEALQSLEPGARQAVEHSDPSTDGGIDQSPAAAPQAGLCLSQRASI
jgi:hypothetical protein